MLLLSLDNLAHRYNLLPSEALERATTFDLKVLDVSAKWSRRQQEIAAGIRPEKEPPKLSQEQMLAMIARTREQKK